MSKAMLTQNEALAAEAFGKQSVVFDDLYSADTIIRYKRDRVRTHISQYLLPGSHILELNAGTGEDAIYLAEQGYRVHTTDIAEGMLEKIFEKTKGKPIESLVTQELCSYTNLEQLTHKGPYDMVFSNFAGLNCTQHLDTVLSSLSALVKKNGIVTLVLLPGFCLWEILLLFKGKIKTALRRFSGRKGTIAHVEGTHFHCYYYNPSFVIEHLKNNFVVESIEGLCTIVPPSYMEGFAEKYPRIFRFLCRLENSLKRKWPWKCVGDYYIISLRRK